MTDVIRGPYLADLLVQARAVEDTLAQLAIDEPLAAVAARFRAGGFRRVVLTGMGSSLAALHPLAIRLAAHGAAVIDASELIHAQSRLIDAETLVVAASQSGRSAEIVRLLERLRPAAVVGVTNTAGSPLATGATAALLTRAGTEATVSCKTYVAGLAALVLVGDALLGESEIASLAAVPAAMQAYLDRWEDHVEELLSLGAGVRDVFVAGRGASLAAAYTAGLILKESTRMHAEGMTSAALRHGPLEMAADHVLALVYEGDAGVAPLNAALVKDLARAGARAALVGPSATRACLRVDAAASARPLLEILPAQMLSLALAAHAGIEAGRFVHATKVTATE